MADDALPAGAYSEVVTEALEALLANDDRRSRALVAELRDADADDRLGMHVGALVSRSIAALRAPTRPAEGAALAARLIDLLAELLPADNVLADQIAPPPRVLEGVRARRPDGELAPLDLPLTPLLDTTVLTNARGEPAIQHELAAEIPSATGIDVVMAFVRWSGVRPLLPALRRHCDEGRRVRLITTTYTNSTEARALDELAAHRCRRPGLVRHDDDSAAREGVAVPPASSSDDGVHRIVQPHAQCAGHRAGVERACLGSAQPRCGVEDGGGLRVVLGERRLRPVRPERSSSSGPSSRTSGAPSFELPPTEIHLRPFQERLLEQIEVARRHGRHRNLLVAATGTGKTVMAAVDYARLRSTLPRARLLFVAHRQEILEQSRATFRHALRDASFGELWVGQHRPQRFEHVFASIQSLRAVGLDALDPTHFDVVIVDEFHHAAAPSYRALLEHVEPTELLGLTATPERADGLDVLRYFDGRIAAELRVWDAIDQQYLVPFTYYGIHDGLDLTQVPWRRGQGYDIDALTNVYTANDIWVGQLVNQLRARVADVHTMRALGFCVSVEHARFMARQFEQRGISARAVWGDSRPERSTIGTPRPRRRQRRCAVHRRPLQRRHRCTERRHPAPAPPDGERHPVPAAARPRPTPSRSASPNAPCSTSSACTAASSVSTCGTARCSAAADTTCSSKSNRTSRSSQPAATSSSIRSPESIVLTSIRNAIPTRWPERVAELRSLGDVSLSTFLAHSGLELDDVYANNRSWSELRRAAGHVGHAASGRERDAAASGRRPPAACRRRRTHRPLPRLRRRPGLD